MYKSAKSRIYSCWYDLDNEIFQM